MPADAFLTRVRGSSHRSTGRQLAILDARAVVKPNTYRPDTQQMNFRYLLDVSERPQVPPTHDQGHGFEHGEATRLRGYVRSRVGPTDMLERVRFARCAVTRLGCAR
jgi:hypothetical protein